MDNKPSIYDITMDKLLARQGAVQTVVRKRFEHTKPFRTQPISNDEMMVYYNEMISSDNPMMYLNALVQKHGRDKVNEWVGEMEKMRQRRGMTGGNLNG